MTAGRLTAAFLVAAALCAPQARAEPPAPLTALVDAAAQRLQLAEPVAAYKWTTHGAIEDPGRAQQELAALRAEASAQGVDPAYVTRVFGDQISATEAVEYSRFAGWKLDPGSAPTAPPDLSASRSAIDALNETMLSHLVADGDLLHSPSCASELDVASTEVLRARQLDDLYRQALSSATRSYCQG